MEIRKITPKEQREALNLVWRVFLKFEAPDYTEKGIQEFKKSIDDESFIKALDIYGAFENHELLGVIATRNLNHIALLFVEGIHHKKGVGKALYKYVCDKNNSNFFTVNSSPYAKIVYEKLGFKYVNSEQIVNGIRFYPMRNDNIK